MSCDSAETCHGQRWHSFCVSNYFQAASANSEGVGTDDEILAISKAGRVLLEVQAARDRLEMQCALQEAENQLVSMEQLSQALCAESANM